jgi:hypothetical protein
MHCRRWTLRFVVDNHKEFKLYSYASLAVLTDGGERPGIMSYLIQARGSKVTQERV